MALCSVDKVMIFAWISQQKNKEKSNHTHRTLIQTGLYAGRLLLKHKFFDD